MIGILGGGQLARMLALAAYPLGFTVQCCDPIESTCAGDVADLSCIDWNNAQQLKNFIDQVNIVTFETENVPVDILKPLLSNKLHYPNIDVLVLAQDRLFEKQLFQSLNISTAPFYAVDNKNDLLLAVKELGFPCILKTRRFGYDGKGQAILKNLTDIENKYPEFVEKACILEGFVDFDGECSLIAARDKYNNMVFYPLTKNQHEQGILVRSRAPFENKILAEKAQIYMTKLLQKLDYVGVCAVEFFYCGNELMANEMAPRVHNSGHWTIEGAVTSQFANHIRAIMGLPLGDTSPIGCSYLYNGVGTMPAKQDVLRIPGAYYHDYHKKPRPGRKIGHITLNARNEKELEEKIRLLN